MTKLVSQATRVWLARLVTNQTRKRRVCTVNCNGREPTCVRGYHEPDFYVFVHGISQVLAF